MPDAPVIDTTAARLDFRVTRGDSFAKAMTFARTAGPINLTGYTFTAQIIKRNTVVATITVSPTNLSAGQIDLSLASSVTTGLLAGPHSWHLTWTTPTGDSRMILQGRFVLE